MGTHTAHGTPTTPTAAAPHESDDDTVTMTFTTTRGRRNWVEREALRRKQRHGTRMAAKGPILNEAIDRMMREHRDVSVAAHDHADEKAMREEDGND